MNFRLSVFLAVATACALLAAPRAYAGADLLERGRYLAQIMDCGGCHTTGALAGQPDQARYLAGSQIGFSISGLGVFYPPNLTSDRETGLGSWTEEEIMTAVRTGVRPDGRILAPVMPYHAYAALTDDDALALAVYLKSLPPVTLKAPEPAGSEEDAVSPYLTMKLPGAR